MCEIVKSALTAVKYICII